ncbi:MAG: AAA family ATPase [Bacteroidetes bacterium]|nr:AAA family ATPase [Bacteroidota bacterium]
MTNDNQNAVFQLAFDLANTTSCNLYLTGKAGTGKTTFLKYLKENCKKKLVVVAPTGVAAINAGGVTIHSFFQLPFGAYIPDAQTGFGLHEGIVNKHALAKNLKIAGNKKKIIDELELLIIDEVSMLRSDMLDAMDTVLRMLRKNQKPFGGVQVVFIGDLYQLPPVVKEQEKIYLDQYYQSAFFFDAKVLEQNPPVYLELKKIYRQNEEVFINLLNKIRHANLTEEDLNYLHQRYQPNFTGSGDNYITLTTHNHKADVINARELNTLHSPLYEFSGELKGDFSEKQLPTERHLKLKKGLK